MDFHGMNGCELGMVLILFGDSFNLFSTWMMGKETWQAESILIMHSY